MKAYEDAKIENYLEVIRASKIIGYKGEIVAVLPPERWTILDRFFRYSNLKLMVVPDHKVPTLEAKALAFVQTHIEEGLEMFQKRVLRDFCNVGIMAERFNFEINEMGIISYPDSNRICGVFYGREPEAIKDDYDVNWIKNLSSNTRLFMVSEVFRKVHEILEDGEAIIGDVPTTWFPWEFYLF